VSLFTNGVQTDILTETGKRQLNQRMLRKSDERDLPLHWQIVVPIMCHTVGEDDVTVAQSVHLER
jgi:hypothetical protein